MEFIAVRIVILFSAVICTYGYVNETECIIKTEGALFRWNIKEPLKIDFFIPPNWGRSSESPYLYFSFSNVSFILNSTLIDEKEEVIRRYNFISYRQGHKPEAGWTSIFLFCQDDSIQVEDQFKRPLIFQNSFLNQPIPKSTTVVAKGMDALVNCKSNLRTLAANPNQIAKKDGEIKIPLTLFKGHTRIGFYSNGSMQVVLKQEDETISYICKLSNDESSNVLIIRTKEELKYCGLKPKMQYFFNVSSSMMDQTNIEMIGDLTVGYLKIYSMDKIRVQTYAFLKNSSEQEPQEVFTNSTSLMQSEMRFLPLLIGVSTILILLLFGGIVALVWYILCHKVRQKRERLSSSESWTQQHFDSLRSAADLYIRNTSYEQSGNGSIKKISTSPHYSSPVDDEEYDEPAYADGRNSAYESIYETSYAPPLPVTLKA